MPRHLKFDWVLPDQVFMGLDEERLLQKVKQDTALRLFEAGHISSGFAAKLLGMSRREFLELLEAEGIPFYAYKDEEFEQRFRAGEELLKELEQADTRKAKAKR